MARNTQLLKLLEMLRAETGKSTLVSAGLDTVPAQKQKLQRVQETLYDAYAWPFLRVFPDKTLSAGQRYYDAPTNLNFDRIEKVVIWNSGQPIPVERGISFEQYASYDSESGVRMDPVLRWDLRWNDTATQIEVWPIPASNNQRLQFQGIRPLRPLIANDDRADLDDQLIVLFAASELLSRQSSKDADKVEKAAQKRWQTVTGNTQSGAQPVIMGGGAWPTQPLRGHTIIRVK